MWMKITIGVVLASSLLGCVVAPDHESNHGQNYADAERRFGQYHHSSDDRNQKAKNHRHTDQRSHDNNKYKNHPNSHNAKHWQQGRHRD